VLVSAGEVSGDRIAAPVVEEIQRRCPGARFFGAGGTALEQAGVEILHPISRLSVTGLTEALGRAGGVLRMLADLSLQGLRRRPDLALLVDFPGANLRLASALGRAGIPILYYVAPQRWAWLGSHIGVLRQRVQRLAVTLPFEEPWFRERGIDARFVGHPLLELFSPLPRAVARQRIGLDNGPALALLPGSRVNEVQRHLPVFLRAVARLGMEPVLAAAPGDAGRLARAMAPALKRAKADVALSAADVALCASGTATLEAAMAGVPAVVCYRLSPLTHAVARRLVKVEMVALPNLVLGQRLLPELIQRQMTPAALCEEVERLLRPDEARRVRAGLAQVVGMLGEPDASRRVAEMALELMERPNASSSR